MTPPLPRLEGLHAQRLLKHDAANTHRAALDVLDLLCLLSLHVNLRQQLDDLTLLHRRVDVQHRPWAVCGVER